MDEMRVWDGVKESYKQKLLSSTWAGQVEKMGDEKMGKRAGAPKVEEKMEARSDLSDPERVGKNGKLL